LKAGVNARRRRRFCFVVFCNWTSSWGIGPLILDVRQTGAGPHIERGQGPPAWRQYKTREACG
jgi:hypothetical protein